MKYIKSFSTEQDYEDFISTNKFATPNISSIETQEDIKYDDDAAVLIVKIMIQSISNPTQIASNYDGSINKIEIDDETVYNINQSGPISHQFETKGIHTMKVSFKNKYVIGNGAPLFMSCPIIDIKISNIFTTIAQNAFNGTYNGTYGIRKINIPDSVTNIDSSAFASCTNLESVIIGNSVTNIGSSTFGGCQLKKITFGKGLTQLNSVSYYGVNSSYLEECNILSNITELPSGMFSNCNKLTKVTLPNSLTTIASGLFYYCSSLTNITIPDSVTSIDSSAFSNCYRLTSITIPNSVTSIGDYAFSNSGLIELNIPDSVTNIGGGAFSRCELKKITFGKGLTQLNSLYGTSSSYLEECNILSNITELPSGMFSNCNKLTKVTLPNSLTTIASGLFYYCSSLTSITIPNSVTSIEGSAFYYCSDLTSITIPESVTSIGGNVFNGCTSLTDITIPDSVTSIGSNAFNGCTKLFYTVDNIYYVDVNNNFGSFMTGISDTTQTSYAIKEGTTRIDADIPNLPNAVLFTLSSTLKEIKDYSLDNIATILTQEQLEYALNINKNCISTSVKHQLFGYVENGIKYYYNDTTEKLELLEFTDTTLTSYAIKNGVNAINISIPQLSNAQSISIPNTITSLINNSFNNIVNILTKQQIESLLAINSKSISYNKLLEYYYTKEQLSNEYFTIYNNSNSYLYLYWYQEGSGEETDVMQYSSDNGVTWITMPDSSNKESSITIVPNDKRIFKSTLTPEYNGIGKFACSSYGIGKDCFIVGNIMSLLYGDNFINQTSLSDKNNAFKELFYGNNYITNAEYLILPATTLAGDCYCDMFRNCTSLTTAPELPATTLTGYCYREMFRNCKSLITAPELPATTLAYYCYSSMFYDCTSLTTAPELSATTLASSCYSSMFQGCTSLTTAPELSATTLAEYCYRDMFDGCTNLTIAPELSATTLASSCYSSMFRGCTSLTTAPELSATTLANSCYHSMFRGCTGLTTAPELPATTLAEYCYRDMFDGCTSLTTAPELPATILTNNCYDSMFAVCTSLTTAPELPATTLAESCYFMMFYNCTSLTTAPELPATTMVQGCYNAMFQGCTSLTTAPELPATTLANGCYSSMFNGCDSLNYIKALFTTTPGSNYTFYWVNGVANSGTFIKSQNATWNVTGTNGIPSGWNVQNA